MCLRNPYAIPFLVAVCPATLLLGAGGHGTRNAAAWLSTSALAAMANCFLATQPYLRLLKALSLTHTYAHTHTHTHTLEAELSE